MRLPSRILDVKAANVTGHIKLFESDGLLAQYIALSHCWGDSKATNDDM